MADSALTDTPAEAEPAPASPAKKRRAKIIILVLLGVALVGGLVWFLRYQSYGKFQQSTNDAYVQADSVTVAPKVSGYVDRVLVAENQTVKAGDPLVRIDARDYRAQAQQSEAQIDVARANARGVEAQIAEQQAAIARARAELAVAQTDASFADAEVARYAPLAETGAETRERVATLRNQARQASARVAAARAALTAAERRVGTLRAQIAQAEAQAEGARAQLDAAQTDVGATLIRAAIDGRIGDKTVRVGQFVQAGTRLMSVVPTRDLYIEANFKETQLGLMRVGQPVRIEVDALPGVEIPGRVASIAPGTGAQFSVLPPQNATGNFTKIVQRVPVRIALSAGPAARALLVAGMSVEVSVDTRSARDAAERIAREQEAHNERIGR
ncbi:HlyD family secretion protein [Sphingomonas sp.]|uniref:HlyD family secretion protein n=1 Tax=Sphingomonas sp. TaxID=28214 RepID=UPI002BC22629|nr:HlyD family secretion protein [Sphingomonas sp.]HTG37300.1 HlyD family secretion protein [Sphingomonas sp.]